MADPSYPIAMAGGVAVVEAPQEIDAANAAWFGKVLLQAAFCGHETVVVTMTATQLCDSAGVHALVGAHQRAVAEGGELLLVVPARGAVRRIFELTGIDFLIPNFTDLSEALQKASAVGSRPRPWRVQRGVRIRVDRQPPGPGAAPSPAA
jgi:anti-sigma B factor antagonist